METVFTVALIVLIIGGAVFYILREKKKGKKCIGCPYSASCAFKKNGCTCTSNMEENSEN